MFLKKLLAKVSSHSQKVPIYLVFSGYDYCGQSSCLGLEENENGQISPRRKTVMETKMDFASQNLTAGQLNAIVKNLGGEEGALKFLRGELVVQPVVIPEPPPEPVLDFIVRVDRSVKPTYPDWFKKLEHPELECSGPAEYNLQEGVEQWLHDDQKRGSVVGNTIYKNLQKGDNLVNCLNLQDGLAIQAKGIAVFRKLFAGKAVFLWGSVVQNQSGYFHAPYLVERGGEVVLGWGWLGDDWDSRRPALRFGNK